MKKKWIAIVAVCLALVWATACQTPIRDETVDVPEVSRPEPPVETTPEPEPPASEEQPETPVEPEQPTPEPEPEPESPAAVKDRLLRSKTDGLAVRSGRGTSYNKLGTLDKGDMVPFIAKSGNWYQTVYCERTAYVSAAYVETVEMDIADDTVEAVIDCGKRLLGLPYVYGAQRYHWGNGVLNIAYDGKSYDCSSLVQYAFKKGANINLAPTSREQSVQGRAVTSLQRGDLMFFTNASRVNKSGVERIGHVGIYLGGNMILHTASDHAVIESISATRWGYYLFARRIL